MSTPSMQPLSEQNTAASLNTHSCKPAHPWGYFLYCECMKIFRNPAAVIFGVGFPTMFFLIFANVYNDPSYARTVLAQYSAYGAFIVAFQTFSIMISTERSQGWNKLLRTTPMSALLYLGAKFLAVIVTGIASLLLLFAVAAITGRVSMDISLWGTLFLFMLLGMIPFGLIGIFLGFLGSPTLTQPISTIVTFILAFASGFFLPLQFLPSFVRTIAVYLPTYHLGQLALYAVNSTSSLDNHSFWLHLGTLAIFAIIFALLAIWAYTRDENKNFA